MLRCGFRSLTAAVRGLSSLSGVCMSPNKERQAQESALLNETCIQVDENDKVIGPISKKDCHRVDANGRVKLHRAFSVYLFNSQGEFLIHRRSKHKITYPNLFTNTCCSHPLYNIEGEMEEENQMGVRRAARRKLNQELGIPIEDIKLEDLNYLMRFVYHDAGDGVWGEHEVAYMFVLQKDFELKPNPSEIGEVRYIKRENFERNILALESPLTPWFNLMAKYKLKTWWDNLDNLDKCKDHQTIEIIKG